MAVPCYGAHIMAFAQTYVQFMSILRVQYMRLYTDRYGTE